MKTIKEAEEEFSEKHAFRVPYDGSNNYYDKVDLKASTDGFIAGAAFAQRWIPVEEELPKNNHIVLIKGEGLITMGCCVDGLWYSEYKFKIGFITATHWRPIELN